MQSKEELKRVYGLHDDDFIRLESGDYLRLSGLNKVFQHEIAANGWIVSTETQLVQFEPKSHAVVRAIVRIVPLQQCIDVYAANKDSGLGLQEIINATVRTYTGLGCTIVGGERVSPEVMVAFAERRAIDRAKRELLGIAMTCYDELPIDGATRNGGGVVHKQNQSSRSVQGQKEQESEAAGGSKATDKQIKYLYTLLSKVPEPDRDAVKQQILSENEVRFLNELTISQAHRAIDKVKEEYKI